MPTALERTYLEIGRLYVQSIEFSERVQEYLEILELVSFSDVVEFAATKARKKPNCTPGKSQWCPGKTGTGACVSLKKQCRVKPTGGLGEAADFNTEHVQAKKTNPSADLKPKKPRASKTQPKEKTAAGDLRGQLMDLRERMKGYRLADEKRMAALAQKHYENPDDNALLSKTLVAQDKFHASRDRFNAKARELVGAYIGGVREALKDSDAIPTQKHSMPKTEILKSFEFEGIRYHFNEQSAASVNITERLITDLASRDKFPEALSKHTRNVYLSEQRHRNEDYWAKKYNYPDFTATATGGDGDVVFYRGGATASVPRSTLAHEMGHNFATSKYGGTTPPPTSEFARAAAQHPAPSDYARVGLNEDFAESVKFYVADPGYLKVNAPARYDVIKRLMEDPDYAG